jgi:Uma2 family endonuclease
MAPQTAILITAEEFAALGDIGPAELIYGKVVRLTAPKPKHGRIAMRLGSAMHRFVRKHKLGVVYAAETGYLLEREPDLIRCPDVSFVRAEVAASHDEDEYYPQSPDLAVEVLSPSDRPEKVKEKVQAWLDGGARAVWTVDGERETITVYPKVGNPRVWQADEAFHDDSVLPGFVIKPISRLFRKPGEKKK